VGSNSTDSCPDSSYMPTVPEFVNGKSVEFLIFKFLTIFHNYLDVVV